MIDENKSRIPIWLLWAQTTNNLVTLVAVTLTNERARQYRVVIMRDPNVVNVKIEPSEANHLYNPDWDSQWQTAYGEEHLRQLVHQVESGERQARIAVEYERERALVALESAKRKIAELELAIESKKEV